MDNDGNTELIVSTARGTVGQVKVYAFRGGGPQLLTSFEPSLTAVAYDPRLIGATAADLLVEAMRSETEAREVRVPVTLVRRRSCGCQPEVSR